MYKSLVSMVLNISFLQKNTEFISATKENIENIFTLFFVSINYATFSDKRGEKTNQTT